MSASLEQTTEGFRVTGSLDFDSVPRLYARNAELLSAGRLTLDLSGVERANSAGVALLLEWRREARRRGVELTLRGVPETVMRVARLSGVEELLAEEPAER